MQIPVLIIYPHKHTFFDNKHNYTQLSRCPLSTTRLSLYNKNRYRTDAIIPVYYFFTPSLLSSYLVSDFSFSSLSSGLFSLESSKKSTLLSRLYRIVFLSHLLPIPLFCTFWNNNNNSPGMRRLYRLFFFTPFWYSFSFFCFLVSPFPSSFPFSDCA